MLSSKRLFGTNGIRGLVNKQLTPEMATKVGSAVGTFFKKGEVIVGHDARTSGPMFAKAVTAGLNSTGCNILFGMQ
jgi:phosphomannomutase/phosphoglucomutase